MRVFLINTIRTRYGVFQRRFRVCKGICFDVDGVLSLPIQEIGDDGVGRRTTNIKDGYAIVQAVKKGYPIAIISGGKSDALDKRLRLLGVKDVFLAVGDKIKVLEDWLKKENLEPKDIMYMGDDIPDFGVMKIVGMPVCPKDAAPEIKAISRYISDLDGGKGCARDVIEQVLKTQRNWFNQERTSWSSF